MPLAQITKPMSFGTLAGAITSGATSITVGSGQGGRFDAIASGKYLRGILIDFNTSQNSNYNRFEVVKLTLLAGDTFTVARGQEGTAAQAFPINAADSASLVKLFVGDTVLQLKEIAMGGGALIQATAPTLTVDSPRVLILTPVAPITVTLPTANICAGWSYLIVNLGTAANTITVNASGGTTVLVLQGLLNAEVCAYQDTPTTNAHWGPRSTRLVAAASLPTVAGELGYLSGGLNIGDGTINRPIGRDSASSNTAFTSTSSVALGATLVIPANSLNADGKMYRFYAYIDTSNAAASWGGTFRFDGTTLAAVGTGESADYVFAGIIIRLSATTCVIFGHYSLSLSGSHGTFSFPTTGTTCVQTVANWTATRTLDFNITNWTSGTMRSIIVGEQLN
jgi:hypothetical protein